MNGVSQLAEVRASQEEKAYVLDTSAIFALVEDEAGAKRVEEILRDEAVLLPFIVLLEAYYIILREKGERMADAHYARLKALAVTHLWEISEPVLLTAGRFKARYSISLADSVIAAFAARHHAVLVHKDPEFEALRDEVLQEPLPYKKRVR